jgi:predicted transcriptional regulator
MTRRPDGALEDAVMKILWNTNEPLLPAEIRERLSMDLAYTSVATVLGRLVAKGLVERQSHSNAFTYRACVDEATLVAQRMRAVLAQSSNQHHALAGFVNQLGKRDAQLLRTLLDEQED